ncbi:hypothetical protein C8R42DRAFT_719846 [Lentinula raphanica]|nr:hypothetical protein C8R42DRAFT_719846 [Lentinula raphanica]
MQIFRFVAALPIPSVKARSQTANTYLHLGLTDFGSATAVPAKKRSEVEEHIKKGLPPKLKSIGFETPIVAPAIEGEPKFIEVGGKKLVGYGALVTAKNDDLPELYQENGMQVIGTMLLDGNGDDLSLYMWGGRGWIHRSGPDSRGWPTEHTGAQFSSSKK